MLQRLKILGVIILIGIQFPGSIIASGPLTTTTISGVLGEDGWYNSNVTVSFDATTYASRPQSLTYSINGGDAITRAYSRVPDEPGNGSFETINQNIPYHWESSDQGLVYVSFLQSSEGNRSVALAHTSEDPTFIYVHNRNNPTPVSLGDDIDVLAQVYPLLSEGSLAYFEVWGVDSMHQNDQLLSYSNYIAESTTIWTTAISSLTVPGNVSFLYLKLGLMSNPTGIAFWDNVRILTPAHKTAHIDVPITENGQFNFLYYTQDTDGQRETDQFLTVKMDTSAPKPWQEFGFVKGVCDNCYETQSAIIDQQSGIQVSSAKYRYYTDYLSQQWSSWIPVSSTVLYNSQSPAPNGSTQMIALQTGEVNYGSPASGPFRVQYKVQDLSGRESVSPIYGLFNPWLHIDGSIFVEGQIAVYSPDPGITLATADVVSGQAVLSMPHTGWEVSSYSHVLANAHSLSTLIPQYDNLLSSGEGLGLHLPTVSGVYTQAGDVVVDTEMLSTGFETTAQSTVVLITGNVIISNDISSIPGNHTIFVVDGDVKVDAQVSEITGIYMMSGDFISDSSGTSQVQLTINGSVIALGQLQLGRDLGVGNVNNNENTPAEVFNWQPQYITDSELISYLTGSDTTYTWREVE